MLESLSDKFEAIFKKLRGEARVRESHLEETLREVRLALLEADVNVEVVKQFTDDRRQALARTSCNRSPQASRSSRSFTRN
jgi:signal recognition particle subunit SRP54